ncbi:hypothetical protein BDN70DRAFT_899635 [Pholiota conissans]|uniref:DUF6532 domain-containing protein n=1 Tax=Pholiota conissans TaxID=109636 RepID=A0A9P6CU47_9AGAR|nr:hypothetical protein BDN70DRAFT_899635 [Pholiota conissans]
MSSQDQSLDLDFNDPWIPGAFDIPGAFNIAPEPLTEETNTSWAPSVPGSCDVARDVARKGEDFQRQHAQAAASTQHQVSQAPANSFVGSQYQPTQAAVFQDLYPQHQPAQAAASAQHHVGRVAANSFVQTSAAFQDLYPQYPRHQPAQAAASTQHQGAAFQDLYPQHPQHQPTQVAAFTQHRYPVRHANTYPGYSSQSLPHPPMGVHQNVQGICFRHGPQPLPPQQNPDLFIPSLSSAQDQSMSMAAQTVAEGRIGNIGPIRETQRQASKGKAKDSSSIPISRTVSTVSGGTSGWMSQYTTDEGSKDVKITGGSAKKLKLFNDFTPGEQITLLYAKELFVARCIAIGMHWLDERSLKKKLETSSTSTSTSSTSTSSLYRTNKAAEEALECIDQANAAAHSKQLLGGTFVSKADNFQLKSLIQIMFQTLSQKKGSVKSDSRKIVEDSYGITAPSEEADVALTNVIAARIGALIPEDPPAGDDPNPPHYAYMDHGVDKNASRHFLEFIPYSYQLLGKTRMLFVGKNAPGVRFPEWFSAYTAELTAFGFTVILTCLHEWRKGVRKTINMTAYSYKPIYESILSMIKAAEKEEYAGNILQEQYKEWCKDARNRHTT